MWHLWRNTSVSLNLRGENNLISLQYRQGNPITWGSCTITSQPFRHYRCTLYVLLQVLYSNLILKISIRVGQVAGQSIGGWLSPGSQYGDFRCIFLKRISIIAPMFRCRYYGIAFLAVWNGRITRGEETIMRNNANTNAFKDLTLKTGTKIVGL